MALKPGTLLGFRSDGRPIYLVGGAAPEPPEDDPDDDPEGEPDDDPESEPDDDPESEPDDDFTPPSREEWSKVQAALTKANNEAKKNRLRLRDLTREREDAERKRQADAAAAAGQTEAHEKALAAAAQAEQRYKPIALRSAAKAAFMQAGLKDVTPDQLSRLSRMLDMDEIEFDDDGEIVGLDTQIDTIKEEFPALFGTSEPVPAAPRRRVPRIDPADHAPVIQYQPMTTGEKIAAQVLGSDGSGD